MHTKQPQGSVGWGTVIPEDTSTRGCFNNQEVRVTQTQGWAEGSLFPLGMVSPMLSESAGQAILECLEF